MGSKPKRENRPGVDRMGRSPLHYAAAEGDAVQVRQLLSSGLDASLADDEGRTPLHFAAQSNSVEVAAELLDAGAVVDAVDQHGNTPLSDAVFNSNGRGELIRLLRARGANPHHSNNHGISPLSLARTIANFDVRQFFNDLPED